ncbi:protein PML isoform X4 [Tympanuchus pallidicinctus]|uniref:protein PML isoform X4 n=1 Tax=Tympanuchus pallidicinctus TaxID=109042 RepID=UPI0022876B21|nr:protein PML isoform X4 [Tympanuchus pallidicinctus]
MGVCIPPGSIPHRYSPSQCSGMAGTGRAVHGTPVGPCPVPDSSRPAFSHHPRLPPSPSSSFSPRRIAETKAEPPAQRAEMPGSPEAPRPSESQEDGPAAPKEPGVAPGPSQCPAPSGLSGEGDFQFVLCEGCRQESPNLKLLTCLHTLCLDCLRENKPVGQCPVCQAPIPQPDGIPDVDNVLFSSLQARLRVYRRISSGGLSCCRCRREAAAVWCSECEEFLCPGCFEDHQWFFKKRSHEARKVEELRAESAHRFLEGTKKSCSLFCSSPGHTEQGHVTSIFCRKCEKPLCCSCALLDAQHSPFYCDIRAEIQRRQDELAALGQELAGQRGGFEASRAALQDEVARLEAAGLEVQELVRQRVEQLVRLIRHEEEELLATVEKRQEKSRRELERELRHVEAVLRRMEAGERLVEKMGLYATEQEVMDMQPFVKDALEELRRQRPAADGELGLHEDFAECRARLQALAERIEGLQGGAPRPVPMVEVALENNLEEPPQHSSQDVMPTFTISLAEMGVSQATTRSKRCQPHVERSSQISPKLLKLEQDGGEPSSRQWDGRGGPSTSTQRHNGRIPPSKASRSHTRDAEDGSIIISSEDSEEDTVMSGTSDFTA